MTNTKVEQIRENVTSLDSQMEILRQLIASKDPEISSVQDTQVATTAKTYTKTATANHMEVFVERGSVRVRTDGQSATAITGEPVDQGFVEAWNVDALSVYYETDAVITVVCR